MRLLDAIRPAAPLAPTRAQRLSLAEAYFSGDTGMGGYTTFSVGGQAYTVPVATTMPGQKTETIANSFEGYVLGALAANSVVFGLEGVRVRVFSEARFQYQRFNGGRPADLWGDESLHILEHPWPGGTTGDLLAAMLLHADFGGNAYVTLIDGQLVMLRPDWVDIVLADRRYTDYTGRQTTVSQEKVGYLYYEGGKSTGVTPATFAADAVVHFAPMPDPIARYRGMSWLTPVVREVRGDTAAINHKLAFFENAMTPNIAVSLKEITDPDQFQRFVDKMDDAHKGAANAYKTLYLGAGADVTVIGATMEDFAQVIGKGETRLAQAAGVPAVVAGISEGLQGSSLNAGNFGVARRQFSDTTLCPLWRNASGSLETLVAPPPPSRLWYDTRDIAFLREDQADLAKIQQAEAQAMRELFQAGWEPDAIVAAVISNDLTLLMGRHTGTFSIQVQSPGTTSTKLPSTVDEPPAGSEKEGQLDETPPKGAAPLAPPGKPVPIKANGNSPALVGA